MRRVALLLLAAFLLSGCGVLTKEELKPVPETLTHGRFVYLANRACGNFELRIRRLAHPASPEAAVADLQKFGVPAYERLLFELRGLTPPPSDAVAFRRMLATFNHEDWILHRFLEAAEASQVSRAYWIRKRLDHVARGLNASAAKLGLDTCAKG
jgi:hypothetical protein